MVSKIADVLVEIKEMLPEAIEYFYVRNSQEKKKKKGKKKKTQFHLRMSSRKNKICVHFVKSLPLSTHLFNSYVMNDKYTQGTSKLHKEVCWLP